MTARWRLDPRPPVPRVQKARRSHGRCGLCTRRIVAGQQVTRLQLGVWLHTECSLRERGLLAWRVAAPSGTG